MKYSRTFGVKLFILMISIRIFPWEANAQSPYRLDTQKELIITGSGLIIGGLGFSLSQQITPLTPAEISGLSPEAVNVFDRPATYNYSKSAARWSDILVGSAIILPTTLLSQKLIREDWQTFSVMYLQTLMFANFVPLISKGRVQRIRPYVYNEDVSMEDKLDRNARRSFYSGHTTNAFATATFLSITYGQYYPHSRWKPYVWTGSLGLASLVGYLRYEAGKHFPTDILVGAAVGSSIGFLVPYLHRTGNSENGAELSLSPLRQVGIQLRFDF